MGHSVLGLHHWHATNGAAVVVIADGADRMLGEVLALVVYVLIVVASLLGWLPPRR